MHWKKNSNRFVAFFDILGFKDMVLKSTHTEILGKLEKLKKTTTALEKLKWDEDKAKKSNLKLDDDQTRSVSFSDSIVVFSKGDTIEDLFKIIVDSWFIVKNALKNDIAIKGAISFGEVTVDFEKSLFFGQPIIDAFFLHEDLYMLGVVLDHNAENQMKSFPKNETVERAIKFDKVKMKFGASSHTIVAPTNEQAITESLESLKKLYKVVSGKPRIYIDNSIEYYEGILKNIKS